MKKAEYLIYDRKITNKQKHKQLNNMELKKIATYVAVATAAAIGGIVAEKKLNVSSKVGGMFSEKKDDAQQQETPAAEVVMQQMQQHQNNGNPQPQKA